MEVIGFFLKGLRRFKTKFCHHSGIWVEWKPFNPNNFWRILESFQKRNNFVPHFKKAIQDK